MKSASVLLLLVWAAGCETVRPSAPKVASPEAGPSAAAQAETAQEVDETEKFQPRPVTTEGQDWIQLVSGEWLRGELSSLSRERIEFESEELDELVLDWEDVTEVVTDQPFTLLLVDRSTVVGVPAVRGDEIVLTSEDGERRFTRGEIMGFIRGRPTEGNYWSGHLKLGGTVRRGNTDQVDTSLSVATTRRTAASRLSLSLDSVFGEVEGVESINNQTATGSMDYYVTPRLYVRPLGFELYKDSIQNIDLRATPYAALGYMLIDRARTEWEANAGLGYRYIRYESVPLGQSDLDETLTAVLGTRYTHEITSDIDLGFDYVIQIGMEDASDSNQEAEFDLTFDFVGDLDFNFSVVWNHVGMPEADANGVFPDKEDLRLVVGLHWKF